MDALIRPATLLAIIIMGYALKRFAIVGNRDYRVIQTLEFGIILPGAIIHSFAATTHSPSLLWVSAFGLVAAGLPPLLILLSTRRRRPTERAFLTLNGSGFNVGCFSFPLIQSFLGSAGLVPAAMFNIGNNVMVSAGTDTMMRSALRIGPGDRLDGHLSQDRRDGPLSSSPSDPDARRLARRARAIGIARGFASSAAFDTYMIMVALLVAGVRMPSWIAVASAPFSDANAFCSMIMVGMLTELPASTRDSKAVAQVLAWRILCGILLAAAAWFLLPFDAVIREAVALCCLAPTAIFATMFTDKVLGNATLAGFTLSVTAVTSLVTMTGFHLLVS
ncbi:MAG: permease [Bifidobacterium minimum]|jgi:predicted permease|nr:permease [Bifidobacterium minimum]